MDGLILTPLSGETPTSAVVLMHGYGADCMNLADIGDYWRQSMPDTLIILPNGVEKCEASPVFDTMGRQWFSLYDRTPDVLAPLAEAARLKLMEYVRTELDRYKISASKVIISGFSQGSMMSFVASYNDPDFTPAGILGYSGRYLATPSTPPAKPEIPVCLIHGDADDVLPIDHFHASVEALKAANITPESHIRPNLTHAIDQKGLDVGLDFIKRHLS